MARVEFIIETGGTDPRQEAAVEKMILDELSRRIRKRIELMTCTQHGRGARVVARGRVGERFDLEVKGCCATFCRKVKWRLDDIQH